jgi:hypothetical protein
MEKDHSSPREEDNNLIYLQAYLSPNQKSLSKNNSKATLAPFDDSSVDPLQKF